ncbi:MAG: carboxypeptidase regulatory-like domain-containing protein, partial [Acidobacteria bacterium]|nr:carboxypeptidase regulatory-like domain-containing protein [Acidobacteriota bacterium]
MACARPEGMAPGVASRLPIAVAAVLGCLLAPVDAGAQRGQTGSLVGIVRDTSGAALPGVKLTASSPQSIGGPHQTESDAWGRYRFASLLPGTYEVTAALQGFKTLRHSEIEVPPGFTLRLDLRLELAAVAEVVDVRAGASAIDTHTATSPALLDRQLLENLPIDRRSVFLLANLAPGVTRGVAFGGTGGANPFSLDGTHGTDPISGQVSAVVSVNWIDELQVVSLGANAEYGEYTGARVNAITRSGSNRFSGLAEYVTTRPNWTGNNRGSLPPDLAQRFRPIEVLKRWEISQQVGGPIVQNRLWFFSGLTYYKNAQRPVSFAGMPRTPDEPRTLTRQPRFLVKLTGAPSSRLRLDGYVGY